MELSTISEISKNYGITTRTLRYYEEIGLLECTHREGYAYRMYDSTAVRRLQQIIILRKLRIPLKSISDIINDNNINKAIEIFQDNINQFNKEIKSIEVIRNALMSVVNKINDIDKTKNMLDIMSDDELINVVSQLAPSKNKLMEAYTMDDIKKADEALSKIKDARVVYLPPATVAASQYIGENPEDHANEKLVKFIREADLFSKKPDMRVYGFNNPCPKYQGETYGYEFWVTIPEDMQVPEGIEKKHFDGGLYMAHCIKMGDFHEWPVFYQFTINSKEYEIDMREPLGMDGSLEEELNAYTIYKSEAINPMIKQLDLLIPIKSRTK